MDGQENSWIRQKKIMGQISIRNIGPQIPPGHNFIVWLSHDVDRVHKSVMHSIYYALKEKRTCHLRSIFAKPNPYWDFEWIMKTEEKLGVRSTFFFLNETMPLNWFDPKTFILATGRYKFSEPRIKDIIKQLDRNGWEIGLHGSFNSYLNEELLKQEKSDLEDIVGHEVKGVRQHYLNLDVPYTWEIQQKIGLKYDASYGLTKEIGFRDEKYHPFQPFENGFTVFPLAIMDTALFRQYKNWEEAKRGCLEIIDIAEKKKTVLSVLWHQRVFTPGEFPGRPELYEFIIQECQRRRALFCTGNNIFNRLN